MSRAYASQAQARLRVACFVNSPMYDEVDYEDSYLDNIDDPNDEVGTRGLMGNGLYEDDDDDGIVELRRTISAAHMFIEEFDSPMPICGLHA
jgi:hypothetical protein